MNESGRKLDALAYALGWLVLISWVWLLAGWAAYLGRLAGKLRFPPEAWLPTPGVHLIFIGVAKLMIIGLTMAWLGVLLYRKHLRRP
jgi:hypothetical protein